MDDNTAERLELPLRSAGACGNSIGFARGSGRGVANSEDLDAGSGSWWQTDSVVILVVDLLASAVFWYVLLFMYFPDYAFYAVLGILIVAMLLWRVYRARVAPDKCSEEVPYTCGFVAESGKQLFLVATLHISPRAPKDVEAVIASTRPDVAMIELDEERLDRMRDVEVELAQAPKEEDLQPIAIMAASEEPMTIFAQKAFWNGEQSGETISGEVVFDAANAHGLAKLTGSGPGSLALVQRGSPSGEFAPFALKAHNAARGGTAAVLVINQDDCLPVNRIGGGTVVGDLRVAINTCSCGFPPVPVLLLLRKDGERLLELCRGARPGAHAVRAEFRVLEDSYPRRTLRRRICQAFALMFSGIGILYGIIQCFSVEVGAEFLAAEVAASARGIPCTCIDVDLNRFWSRLGMALLPTPCNLGQSLLAWLAFPRVFFRVLFPAHGSVDIPGSMLLHVASFPLRTWVAFVLAGMCSSFVTSHILKLIGFGAEQAGERSGVVAKEDRDVAQAWIMLGIEMYMMPQIYNAVAASRDEAMYQSIVAKSRELRASRLVAVVGAGHANGILQRARARGL